MNAPFIYKLYLKRKRCRVKEALGLYDVPIHDSSTAKNLAARLLKDEAQEVFIALHLDSKNRLVSYVEVARGGLESCVVDPRIVFSTALIAGASTLILAHNHPSGDSSPSTEDRVLTSRLVDIGNLIGIPILDHLIVGHKEVTSLTEQGVIPTRGEGSRPQRES